LPQKPLFNSQGSRIGEVGLDQIRLIRSLASCVGGSPAASVFLA
jgi:hypothetical protein